MDAIVDYNYRITQGITVDKLLKMSDENIKKALLDLHKIQCTIFNNYFLKVYFKCPFLYNCNL